ncbi:hypothetical protein SAMN02746095_02261 [Acidocella aminolytica 101 = DSM 11237]|uniref:Uncharacterized protein n=1 Tax=Acidocella aminolytica 101 = DSM 11237 TaxID=1120923 RepID=A0A0D6PDY6_9PROT|nr:hypothetical protein Aam_016_044 [Acidocella aminolytica 101 = DSM 11237]GBQ40045.1 hypothetical protein AA11237_2249 [Acidocella aminolytica 101 = DSM 11237]SHF14739.1 hypothetical protein SAMN02746095_02261 [Acidocella aminolytica 101 = DSM 11237]
MCAQLFVAVLAKAFDGSVPDRLVHPLDLAVGPGMILLHQTVLNPVGFADHVEAHLPRICCIPVAGLLGELDAVVSNERVDAIGDGLEQMLEELTRSPVISLVHELRGCKLASLVNANKEILNRARFPGDILV